MKKFLMTTVGIAALGLTVPASAADMAVKAPPPAPVVAIYNWSGFYIGANGGWGQSRNCWDFTPIATGILTRDGCSTQSGGVVGGQIGYRWQTNQFVFGVEGQGDWADLSRTRVSTLFPLSATAKVDGIGLITAQLGWAWNAALLYVKGGAAVTGNRFDVCSTVSLLCASTSSTRWGGTLGVGFEYGFTPNWSFGVEYDHLWMGHANNSFSVTSPVIATVLNDRIGQDVDMVTLRLNYRFGGYGAPVTARY